MDRGHPMAAPGESCTGPRIGNQTEQEPVAHGLLSPCFLRAAGSWAPPMYLWVLGPIYLFYIHRHGRCYLRMSRLFKVKMVLGFALVLLYTFNVAMPLWRIHQGMPQAPELLIHPTVWLTTMSFATFLIHTERKKGIRTSGVLFGYWLLCCLLPAINVAQQASAGSFHHEPLHHLATYLCLFLVVAEFVLSCLVDRPPFFSEDSQPLNPCPETEASFPSKTMFWWASGLLWRGYRKLLVPKDLWSLGRENSSEELVSRLEREWRRNCSVLPGHTKVFKSKADSSAGAPETAAFLQPERIQRGPLLRAIWHVFRSTFLLGTLSLVISDAFRFAVPKLFSLFLEFMSDQDSPAWMGWLLAVLMFLSACLQTLFEQQHMYRVKVLQMRLRTAITGLVYRKVLVLSSGSRKSSAAGDVVNLVSVDVQRLTESVLYLNGLWLPFLWILVCFVYLWQVRSGGRPLPLLPLPVPLPPLLLSSSPVSICTLRADVMGRVLDRVALVCLKAEANALWDSVASLMKFHDHVDEFIPHFGVLVWFSLGFEFFEARPCVTLASLKLLHSRCWP